MASLATLGEGLWLPEADRDSFREQVRRERGSLPSLGPGEVLLVDSGENLPFFARIAAGVAETVPVLLANPRWRTEEWDQIAKRFGRRRDGVVALHQGIRLGPGEIAIPTGGTGGGLKYAVHDAGTLGGAVESLREALGGGAISAVGSLPPCHVSGLMPVVRACLSGGQVFAVPPVDPTRVPGVLTLSLVPTQAWRLLRDGEVALGGRCGAVFLGGGPVGEELLRELWDRGIPAWAVYGMTETAGMVAASRPGQTGAAALPGVEFRIGPVGSEILIRSAATCRRYLGGEDFGAWFPTGDRGSLSGGRLKVQGRIRPQIVTGGEKVDPEEVEMLLRTCPGVEDVRVVGLPDPEWGEVVVAAVVGPSDLSGTALAAWLRERVAVHKVPRRWRILASWPESDEGKTRLSDLFRGVS